MWRWIKKNKGYTRKGREMNKKLAVILESFLEKDIFNQISLDFSRFSNSTLYELGFDSLMIITFFINVEKTIGESTESLFQKSITLGEIDKLFWEDIDECC